MSATYLELVTANLNRIEKEQTDNLRRAGQMLAGAIADDRLINVYGGGGHTCLPVAEMFFRAGGLSNINPLIDTSLSPFTQAIKYLEFERTLNFGRSLVKYYKLQAGDVVVVFHNIGFNAATIDACEEFKRVGARIIGVASSYWQTECPANHPIRHPNGKNLFDYAEVCIDDYNPVGDATLQVAGFEAPIAPVSNMADFFIAHRLEIETVKACVERGITPPVWCSANTPEGDAKNQAYLAKYSPRIKSL